MKNPVYIVALLAIAFSAAAFDYAENGYERTVNEEYNFSFWLPPGYELVKEEISEIIYEGKTYKYEWVEGEYQGLMAVIMVVDRRNGLIDLDMLKEANDTVFEQAGIEKINEKPVESKSLILHDASKGFTVTAQYEKKDDEGKLYDYSVLYLQKGVNLYVVSSVSPAKGAGKAKEAREQLINCFRCSKEGFTGPETEQGKIKGKLDGKRKKN